MELPLWGCVCKIAEWWVGVSPVQVFFNRSPRGCLCGAWGTSARSLTQGLLLGVSPHDSCIDGVGSPGRASRWDSLCRVGGGPRMGCLCLVTGSPLGSLSGNPRGPFAEVGCALPEGPWVVGGREVPPGVPSRSPPAALTACLPQGPRCRCRPPRRAARSMPLSPAGSKHESPESPPPEPPPPPERQPRAAAGEPGAGLREETRLDPARGPGGPRSPKLAAPARMEEPAPGAIVVRIGIPDLQQTVSARPAPTQAPTGPGPGPAPTPAQRPPARAAASAPRRRPAPPGKLRYAAGGGLAGHGSGRTAPRGPAPPRPCSRCPAEPPLPVSRGGTAALPFGAHPRRGAPERPGPAAQRGQAVLCCAACPAMGAPGMGAERGTAQEAAAPAPVPVRAPAPEPALALAPLLAGHRGSVELRRSAGKGDGCW